MDNFGLVIIILLILYIVGKFIYELGYSDGWERGLKKDLPNFIVNEKCHANEIGYEGVICNLGYACDACPYNKNVKKELCKVCHKNPATRDGECVDCSH